jgi:hypothetical protein
VCCEGLRALRSEGVEGPKGELAKGIRGTLKNMRGGGGGVLFFSFYLDGAGQVPRIFPNSNPQTAPHRAVCLK